MQQPTPATPKMNKTLVVSLLLKMLDKVEKVKLNCWRRDWLKYDEAEAGTRKSEIPGVATVQRGGKPRALQTLARMLYTQGAKAPALWRQYRGESALRQNGFARLRDKPH